MIQSHVDYLLSLYLQAFTALGVHPMPEDFEIQDDFSCVLHRADHYVLTRILPDQGMTILSYTPGMLNVMLKDAYEYLNAVLPDASPEFQQATRERRQAVVDYACENWFHPIQLSPR